MPKLGLNDSFVDLSVEFLTAVRLVGSIRSELDVDLTAADVFGAPHAELDKLIDEVARQAQG